MLLIVGQDLSILIRRDYKSMALHVFDELLISLTEFWTQVASVLILVVELHVCWVGTGTTGVGDHELLRLQQQSEGETVVVTADDLAIEGLGKQIQFRRSSRWSRWPPWRRRCSRS